MRVLHVKLCGLLCAAVTFFGCAGQITSAQIRSAEQIGADACQAWAAQNALPDVAIFCAVAENVLPFVLGAKRMIVAPAKRVGDKLQVDPGCGSVSEFTPRAGHVASPLATDLSAIYGMFRGQMDLTADSEVSATIHGQRVSGRISATAIRPDGSRYVHLVLAAPLVTVHGPVRSFGVVVNDNGEARGVQLRVVNASADSSS